MRETSPTSPLSLMLPLPIMTKLPALKRLTGWATAKNFFGKLESLIWTRIQEHKATLQPSSPRDLTDILLAKVAATDDAGSPFHGGSYVSAESGREAVIGEVNVANILVDIFTAGMETTSSALAWTFLYMLHHPEVQRKVHRELDEVLLKK